MYHSMSRLWFICPDANLRAVIQGCAGQIAFRTHYGDGYGEFDRPGREQPQYPRFDRA